MVNTGGACTPRKSGPGKSKSSGEGYQDLAVHTRNATRLRNKKCIHKEQSRALQADHENRDREGIAVCPAV